MNDEKKELKVAALENGTVIDHIPSSQLFKVVSILGLENCTNSITIGNNLASKKIGKKGIIKVADRFFKDPKCITNNEPMETIFHVTAKIDVQVKCHYCERSVTKEEIEIC